MGDLPYQGVRNGDKGAKSRARGGQLFSKRR